MADREHQLLVNVVPLDPELGRAIAAQHNIAEGLEDRNGAWSREFWNQIITPASYYAESSVLVDALGRPFSDRPFETFRNPESLEPWEQEGGDPIKDIQRTCEMMRQAESERREFFRRRAFRKRSLMWFRGIKPWS